LIAIKIREKKRKILRGNRHRENAAAFCFETEFVRRAASVRRSFTQWFDEVLRE
jgi:hypothetical protein